ncbi:MAG: nucleotidyltransferase domain-containing protein [Phycisphaerales bacterium]|nr:nucleotidyltransferase domain-containing protein [Phycisphaerales bacterium]
MMTPLDIPNDRLADFCRRWKVAELSLFGSALRDDFGPDSDVDVLVSFTDDARTTAFDILQLRDELSALLGRRTDVVTRRSVELSPNPWKRHEILGSARVVYAA